MFHVFQAVTTAERTIGRAAYRAFLANRDGQLDVCKRTLSKRETNVAPVARAPALSGVSFDPRVYRAVAERPLGRSRAIPGEILIVLALARVHGVFGFGSKAAYSHALERAVREEDDTAVFVALEKAYGKRTLATMASLFGVEPHDEEGRRWSAAAMARAGGSGTGALRTGVLLAQEIVHAVALMNLLRVTGEVFRGAVEARDAIEQRVLEVLADAVGHISFRRLAASAEGLAVAARVLPVVATAFTMLSRETTTLGAGVSPSAWALAFRLENGLPEAVRKAAFLA